MLEGREGAEVDVDGDYLDAQLEIYYRRKRRVRRQTRISVVFTLVMGWFFWGQYDYIHYVFKVSPEPQVIEDVALSSPAELAHNSFVSLTGITEHRGLTQDVLRIFSLSREERWYFRLLGSKGIFVEVPPDAENFQFATRVKVRGRVVDPERDEAYGALLASYERDFATGTLGDVRIVQVDIVPGEGKPPILLLGAVISVMLLMNVVALLRLFLMRRRWVAGA